MVKPREVYKKMAEFIEQGIILSSEGKTATVKITPKGPCPESHQGCPVKALLKNREFTTKAENPINAQPGQKVIVEIETPHFYKGLMLVFVLPLVLLFVGYMAGALVARLIDRQEELFGYMFAAGGFSSSFFLMAKSGKNCGPNYKITKPVNNTLPKGGGGV